MKFNLEQWVTEIQKGNKTYLAKTITLLESKNKEKQLLGQNLLKKLAKTTSCSWRITISGVPGVGKSTFVNSLGSMLIQKGKKVAVLAIDPSSQLTQGSILGDKTRMPDLAAQERAFIRPSPTSGDLGGVTSRTYETIQLCEAAGFDVILLETVGVGQSETTASQLTDYFIHLKIPQTGDDLQGIKRGIMEMSDLIFINKCDSFDKQEVQLTLNYLKKSLPFIKSKFMGHRRKLIQGSGLQEHGIKSVIKEIVSYYDTYSEQINQNRKEQEVKQVTTYAEHILLSEIRSSMDTKKVLNLEGTAYEKATQLVKILFKREN